MKTPLTLTYHQLRSILAITVTNGTIRATLEDLIAGKELHITELDFVDLIIASGADTQLLEIISGQDPALIDALDAMEYVAAFFTYIKSNSAKFSAMLASFGYQAAASAQTTPSNASK